VPERGCRFFAVPVKVKAFGTFPVRAFVLASGSTQWSRRHPQPRSLQLAGRHWARRRRWPAHREAGTHRADYREADRRPVAL